MSALVVTFLSHLEVPSAGALVFKSLRNGTVVLQSLMLDQLHDAEKDMHILKASQISVNSAVSGRVRLSLARRSVFSFFFRGRGFTCTYVGNCCWRRC